MADEVQFSFPWLKQAEQPTMADEAQFSILWLRQVVQPTMVDEVEFSFPRLRPADIRWWPASIVDPNAG